MDIKLLETLEDLVLEQGDLVLDSSGDLLTDKSGLELYKKLLSISNTVYATILEDANQLVLIDPNVGNGGVRLLGANSTDINSELRRRIAYVFSNLEPPPTIVVKYSSLTSVDIAINIADKTVYNFNTNFAEF